jgi:hypothetical protein
MSGARFLKVKVRLQVILITLAAAAGRRYLWVANGRTNLSAMTDCYQADQADQAIRVGIKVRIN